MLRLFVVSDVHFECFRDHARFLAPLPGPDEIDVLVLAGDIGQLQEAVSGIDRILALLPEVPIIYVAGNHEFFHRSYQSVLRELRATYRAHEQVHFLEQDALRLKGYDFLGCTLWSGLDGLGPDAEREIRQRAGSLPWDFTTIDIEDPDCAGGVRPLTPDDMQRLHQQSRAWLEGQLSSCDPLRTIVVTHFPPAMDCRHEEIPVNPFNAYFQADCADLIERYQPLLWLYGHNHYSREDHFGRTRLVSNQWGYPNEKCRYSPQGIVHLP